MSASPQTARSRRITTGIERTSSARAVVAHIDHDAVCGFAQVIVGKGELATKSQVAEQNVLALDIAMFGLYDEAQAKFQKNFLAEHPVIMGPFSNQGGKLTLYRPGKPPVEAPQVPIRYQIYKSVGHSALALFELVGSHLGTVSDQSWIGPMRAFRTTSQTALDSLEALDLDADARENQRKVLSSNTQTK